MGQLQRLGSRISKWLRGTAGFGAVLTLALLAGCTSEIARVAPTATLPASAAPAPVTAVTPAATGTLAASPTPRQTATAAPTSTPTSTLTPTRTPTATATASPSPTPAPQAVQVTEGGCCTQPFWSPDGSEIRFIDKPAGQAVGIYAVKANEPQSAPVLVSQRMEDSLAVRGYVILRANNTTTIERLATGERWTVPARGRNVQISPGETRIAWSISNDELPPEQQVTQIWVADLDGANARQLATIRRGGVSGWLDDDTLLVSGREAADSREQVLWAMATADGSRREIIRAEQLRGATLSPSGRWLVYYTTFDPDPQRNGLWVLSTDGGAPRRAEVFGAYQWRPCGEGCDEESDRLLLIPFDPAAKWHEFWELDPATLEARRLTDGEVTPLKIANGDWRVSPDGRRVAYVAAVDRNIWVLELPR